MQRIPAAPRLQPRRLPRGDQQLQQCVQQQRRRIARDPHLHNGRLLRVLRCSPRQLQVARCEFAWLQALEQLGRYGQQWGPGNLNTTLLLRQGHHWLWQLRGPQLLYSPGVWQLGSGGLVQPGESLIQSTLREAREELGLQTTWLLRPPQLLGMGSGGGVGACVVYLADLQPGIPRDVWCPQHPEVQQIRWWRPDGELPGATSTGSHQHLQLLQQLL